MLPDYDELNCINCGYTEAVKSANALYQVRDNGGYDTGLWNKAIEENICCPHCFGRNIRRRGSYTYKTAPSFMCLDCHIKFYNRYSPELIEDVVKLLKTRVPYRRILIEARDKYGIIVPKPVLLRWAEKVRNNGHKTLVKAGVK